MTKDNGGIAAHTALVERLQRIESRMVRGFSELGAKVVDDEVWCYVDTAAKTIDLKGTSASLQRIRSAIVAAGETQCVWYTILVKGSKIGTVIALGRG